ncbi:ATP-binding protein [Pseudolysinimonas yzui]|uniref:ATPase AAA-type core domain-containing protein n=1 Tax=Pseudolysinimonas yzui TaxID=2708254 RepID=A0A8J3M422_9MICO|nr:ATP-binding protein [Pseudolysinimonas yzui]GHF14646.1 hypothetical protein GCM10011600_14490 [Pseudolysinimonas yzui]
MSDTLVLGARRAGQVVRALEEARVDRSVILIDDADGDFYVDGDALREITRVLSVHAALWGMPTLLYTLAGGAEVVVAPGGPAANLPEGIADHTPATVAIDMLREACLRESTPHLLVLDFAEHLLPGDEAGPAVGDTARVIEQVADFTKNPAWAEGGHVLVLIGRTARIDQRVARLPGVRVVDVGLPQLPERREALALMAGSNRHPLAFAPDLPLDRAARLTGGISLHALSSLRYHTSPERPLEVGHILELKRAAIRQMAGDTLLVHDDLLSLDADVAGLPQVRRILREEARRGNDTLRLILAGPPGNGKNRVSTAIAAALGVPAMQLGRIRGRYVGESEDNLRRAFDTVEANAPGLLMLDEVDQSGLGRRGESAGAEGSEVTANLRAELYTWLGDTGSRLGISVIGLTNRPDLLDEAATDRFTIVPVLHPSPTEAAQIMAIQARRVGIDFDLEGATEALIGSSAAFSGREAVRILDRAQVHAQEAGRERITGIDVASAMAESLHAIGPEEERQSLLALRATSWSGHLPWMAERYIGGGDIAPPGYVQPYVDASGSLDVAGIETRIRALESLRGY